MVSSISQDLRPHMRTQVKTFRQIEKLRQLEENQLSVTAADAAKQGNSAGGTATSGAHVHVRTKSGADAAKHPKASPSRAAPDSVVGGAAGRVVTNPNHTGVAGEIDYHYIMNGFSQKLKLAGVHNVV